MKHLVFVMTGVMMLLSACAPTEPSEVRPVVMDTPEAEARIDLNLVAPTPDGRNLQPLLDDISVDMDEVTALLPPDAIPAILPDQIAEIMVSAAQADEQGIDQEVRVLGVSINGDSRAYPIPFMSRHEIVNDEVGGQLIAATW